MKKTDRITVRDYKNLDVLYSAHTADEWIDLFKKWKDEYSRYEKYGVVVFEINSERYFGEDRYDLCVHFYREETDKEYEKRMKIRNENIACRR